MTPVNAPPQPPPTPDAMQNGPWSVLNGINVHALQDTLNNLTRGGYDIVQIQLEPTAHPELSDYYTVIARAQRGKTSEVQKRLETSIEQLTAQVIAAEHNARLREEWEKHAAYMDAKLGRGEEP